MIWWSAFAFSADACWTLKFRILGLQCQKPWVVPGCFDQDKNDPEEKFSDSEPRMCLLLVSIAWLVPFPPVLFAANCVSRGLQCQALELSNVGKLKDSYNSYPPITESSRWFLLFSGGCNTLTACKYTSCKLSVFGEETESLNSHQFPRSFVYRIINTKKVQRRSLIRARLEGL